MTATSVLLTGATDGLGRALAHRLAEDGVRLIIHGRNRQRLDETADELVARHGGERPITARADLSSLAEVSQLAAEVRDRTDGLDVLVNNAGIGPGLPDSPRRQQSADGFELRFAVNYLAPVLLTLELLDLLRASTPSRIVNVASLGQSPVDFDDLMLEHHYDGYAAYGQSKRALIMFTLELADRLSGSGVTVNSLHPGTHMPTKVVLNELGPGSVSETLASGVEAVRRQVLEPTLAETSGAFFNGRHASTPSAGARDRPARALLWARTRELVVWHMTARPMP